MESGSSKCYNVLCAKKKTIIKWDVFFNEIGPKMKENTRRIVLYYAPTHFHKKSSCFFRSEKSLKSNDVLCASRFRDDKKKHTKTDPWCYWSNENQYKMIIGMISLGWFSSRALPQYTNCNLGAVFCTKYNGILQNQCNPVSIPHSRQYLLKLSSWLSLILGSWTRPQFIDFQYILYMFWSLCSEEFNHLVKNLIN